MIKVFLVSSGLGNVKRGFESFTQECFDTLVTDTNLDITLFKGGGNTAERVVNIANIPRRSVPGMLLGKVSGRGAYFIEQFTFTLSLLPYIQKQQPDVIYFSDGNIGNLLWHWRRLTQQKYKLLYSNGGPLPPDFERWDWVQQVAPIHLKIAIEAGVSEDKQSLVPYGIKMSRELNLLSATDKKDRRQQLGLPSNRTIILSVATINKSHKRLDYLIQELATLPESRPYLLLLGQQDEESAEIFALADKLLGKDNFSILTVPPEQVFNYYPLADIFVLASVGEGLPRALLEAISYGLPCLMHDYEVAHFVLAEAASKQTANFKRSGELANLISQALLAENEVSTRLLRHQSIYNRFSWEQLHSQYVEMIHRCAAKI